MSLSSKSSILQHAWRWRVHAVVGGVLGVWWHFSPGSVFVLLLVALMGALLYRGAAVEDRRFLLTLFLVGFMARALLSLGLDGGSWLVNREWPKKSGPPNGWDLGIVDKTREYMKMGDSDYLSQRGYAAAQLAKGSREPIVLFRLQQGYGWNGYTYVIGAFYYLFDFSPCVVKWLNCVIGALLGPYLFAIAKACFNPSIARWAGTLATYFPSLMLWSASNLKDPSIHLLTLTLCWLFVKIRQARGMGAILWQGLLFVGVLWAHATLRSAVYSLVLVASFLGTAGLLWAARRMWRLVAIGVILLGVLWTHPQQVQSAFAWAFYLHRGHVITPGMSYRYLPEAYYVPELRDALQISGRLVTPQMLCRAIPVAVFHYLLEPLPGKADNLFIVLALVQMMLWYVIVCLAAIGIYGSVRWNSRRSLFMVTTLAAWVVLGALTGGNIGTAVRMRDMITPFVILFGCAGAWLVIHDPRYVSQSREAAVRALPEANWQETFA